MDFDMSFRERIKKAALRLASNRLLLIAAAIFVMFYALAAKLFDLQIVRGQDFQQKLTVTYKKDLKIPAPRGTIFDRFGRPLAVNKSAYTVKIDPGAQVENLNGVLLNLTRFLEEQGEQFVTDFPITTNRPYRFTFSDSDNRTREERWKYDMNIVRKDDVKKGDLSVNAEETMRILREKFDVDEALGDNDAWNVVALRTLIHVNRYTLYAPITLAFDVREDTVVMLEEHGDRFRSVYVDVEPLREYPGAGYVSHIVGYIRKVTQDELKANEAELEENKDAEKYDITDNIGKTGLERAFETELKGKGGLSVVEVGQNWRPIRTLHTTPPSQGGKLFTTLDLEFQKKVYHILENMIREALKNKLKGLSNKEEPITEAQFFSSMVRSNNVSTRMIMDSEPGGASYNVKLYVIAALDRASHEAEAQAERDRLDAMREAEENGVPFEEPPPPPPPPGPDDTEAVKEAVMEGIKSRAITSSQMLLVLHEQGVITGDDAFVNRLQSGRASTLQIILDKLDEGEITPQMTGLDPCTGSVVVVDVADGGVLSAVSYPTYDNNQFVNYFNSDYYDKLNNDPTTPMNNRAFMEPRAPGSTFKMISALAGLESGVIDRYTRIYDEVSFEKAGAPYSKCWSSVSHGAINVIQALEESCNYFFSEMAYRMGNSKENNPMDSISILNKYMIEFGLNERSGVEIGEYRDTLMGRDGEPLPLVVSSPQFKEFIAKSRNPDATYYDYGWFDGDTVRTAWGQANNNYTTAVMAKYVATIATGGLKRDLHLMSRLETQQGETVRSYDQAGTTLVDVDPKNLGVVFEGMIGVTENGLAKEIFAGFPIRVAGKTGTAQEDLRRNDHASFAAFAPYDDPQIAVYVLIPFGDTKTTRAPAAQVARDVIAEYFGLNAEPERPKPSHSFSM